jgi:starvation-inducible DNA-binding protein
MTDDIAERARKIGGTTLHSIGDVARHQRLKDNNEDGVPPTDMLSELCADNQHLTRSLRSAHEICEKHDDVATASLVENWLGETERRTWFLSFQRRFTISERTIASDLFYRSNAPQKEKQCYPGRTH